MNSDKTLWEGLMRGNQDMFLSLYNKYYHTLLFVGLKEIKDSQLVKDTIQQLFLYLWEKRESIRMAENVKSYLLTSFLRKLSTDWKKSDRISNLQVVHTIYTPDPLPTPEESLIKKDEQHILFTQLMHYINELPNRQKELILLKFYEGLSYEEIAQQTGLSHRTIYNKIHEALKRLRLDIVNSQHSKSVSLLTILVLLITIAEKM